MSADAKHGDASPPTSQRKRRGTPVSTPTPAAAGTPATATQPTPVTGPADMDAGPGKQRSALDVKDPKHAAKTQRQWPPFLVQLEEADQRLSMKLHRLDVGLLGELVMLMPAALFQAFSVPLLLALSFLFMPRRWFAQALLGTYVASVRLLVLGRLPGYTLGACHACASPSQQLDAPIHHRGRLHSASMHAGAEAPPPFVPLIPPLTSAAGCACARFPSARMYAALAR
jgi:hypothetical protein